MEQSKSTLDTIKKQHFWILLALVFVMGVVVAVLAKSAVHKKFAERKSALESLQSSMQSLSSDSLHPNDETIGELEVMVMDEKKSVFDAWEEMRRQQQDKLDWPEDLGDDFLGAIRGKSREEVINVLRRDVGLREIYLGFIQEHYPQMLELVERRHHEKAIEQDNVLGEWEDIADPALVSAAMSPTPPTLPGGGSGGGYGGDMGGGEMDMGMGMGMGGGEYGGEGEYGMGGSDYGMGMDNEMGMGGSDMGMGMGGSGMGMRGGMPPGMTPASGIVVKTRFNGKVNWRVPEIYRITSEPEGGRWQRIPYANQIWLAQEDLWVYETLLRVISKTNERSKSHFDSPIQEIIRLDIGRYASAKISQPTYGVFGASLSATDMSYDMDGMEGEYETEMDGDMGMGMGFASTGNPETDKEKLLLNYRYVDAAGVPLGADDPVSFVEFNMMPVHMILKIDQLSIAEFLINCANSSMPIDIQSVRLAPDKSRPFPISQFRQAVSTGMEGEDEGMGMDMGMSMGGGEFGSGMGDEYGSEYGDMGMGDEMGMGGMQNAIRELDPYGESHMIVEVQGVIYIYNEPDFDLVGTGAGVQDEESDASSVDATGVPQAGTSVPSAENVSAS
jgi:hypothetical protein